MEGCKVDSGDDAVSKGLVFILKDQLAEETLLVVGEGMRTVGDLRRKVSEIYDLPEFMQTFIGNGRTVGSDTSDGVSLVHLLGANAAGDEYPHIVWLDWFGEDDYIAFQDDGVTSRQWMFPSHELERKRSLFGEGYTYMTLSRWRSLNERVAKRYRSYVLANGSH